MSLEHEIEDLREEVRGLRERVNAIDHQDDMDGLRGELGRLASFINSTTASKNIRGYIADMAERLKLR